MRHLILKNVKPQVSVVVPAYNEEKLLPICLQHLRRQNFRGNWEIIVVNGPSTDNTQKIAESLADKVVRVGRPGIGLARKKGCKAAKAPIIAVTDADIFVPLNWLTRITEYFRTHPEVMAISGPYIFTNNMFLNILSLIVRPIAFVINLLTTGVPPMSGNNSAFRKKAYDLAGGYDSKITALEDIDLAMRLKTTGKIVYLPTLIVKTTDRRFRARILSHLFGSLIPAFIRRLNRQKDTGLNLWPVVR